MTTTASMAMGCQSNTHRSHHPHQRNRFVSLREYHFYQWGVRTLPVGGSNYKAARVVNGRRGKANFFLRHTIIRQPTSAVRKRSFYVSTSRHWAANFLGKLLILSQHAIHWAALIPQVLGIATMRQSSKSRNNHSASYLPFDSSISV
jgi:hypothetical protein